MFREGTSKQSSDSHMEQEQRSKKSSYENGSFQIRRAERISSKISTCEIASPKIHAADF